MNNKYYIELVSDRESMKTLSEESLMTQIRLIAHRLDKSMQFSQSRKKTFTESELNTLKSRLDIYKSRFTSLKDDYLWAETIMTLYESALKKTAQFNYPWNDKPASDISEAEFDKFMSSRRSIRNLTSTVIPDEKIKKIIRYGLWAPSTCNMQAVKFYIIKDKEVRGKINIGGFAGNDGYCTIAVIADYRFYDDRNIDGLIHDSAAAIQNILLGAHYYGIGACYVSDNGVDSEKFRTLLGIESYQKITALIWFGNYENEPIAPARRNIEEVIKVI
jgi:nitroreductase